MTPSRVSVTVTMPAAPSAPVTVAVSPSTVTVAKVLSSTVAVNVPLPVVVKTVPLAFHVRVTVKPAADAICSGTIAQSSATLNKASVHRTRFICFSFPGASPLRLPLLYHAQNWHANHKKRNCGEASRFHVLFTFTRNYLKSDCKMFSEWRLQKGKMVFLRF